MSLKTYTVTRKNGDFVWVFKYDLNGILAAFEVLDGMMTESHVDWLYLKGFFPYRQMHIETWGRKFKDQFSIVIGEPDLSFDRLWEDFGHKMHKKQAVEAFNKCRNADRVKVFQAVPGYRKYLSRTGIASTSLERFIKKEYYNTEWDKIK